MATIPIDSTLCSTPVKSARRVTWIIEHFDILIQDTCERSFYHPMLNILMTPYGGTSSDWHIECWPKHVGGSVTRLRVCLGNVHFPQCYPKPGPKINVSVTAELLEFGGTGEPLGESTGWYEARKTVLDVEVPHERLTSAADRYRGVPRRLYFPALQ
jgi:hypothetical protein